MERSRAVKAHRKYWRTSAAAPAQSGVAIEVPLIPSTTPSGREPSEHADRMSSPGHTTSGLNRPSAVGPRDEKKTRFCARFICSSPYVVPSYSLYASRAFSPAPIARLFLAVAGSPTVAKLGPSLPAATSTWRSAIADISSSHGIGQYRTPRRAVPDTP
eukprot:1577736-Rhodomonas_salina.1